MDSFMDWFWLMVWWFFFFMYLMILFRILADLFRDHELSGWWKALWIVALVVFPFVSALVYVIARGRGMAERQMQDMSQAKAQTDAYIRDVSGSQSSAATQIADAKALLDSGVIDQDEFATLKAKALA
ncbi:SHOCT domain-containing protein [Oerskovia sp. Sa1BUA8]|uniref:SHOCT domain-containing protein n=1 Tax=Oerskovia douganii TaxID=2762210 RepID=A0A9D5U9K8_9CELL|nr:SHOCT domain-containing protein [Oerskovia douganii]MBE7701059.1 SHOCT domain-containing protein [Oerskovia douganii]